MKRTLRRAGPHVATGIAIGLGSALVAMALPLLAPSMTERLGAVARTSDTASLDSAAAALPAGDVAGAVTLAQGYVAAGDTDRARALLERARLWAPRDATIARLLASLPGATPAPVPGERAALLAAVAGGSATTTEVERLAAIEEFAGAGEAARARLAALGRSLTTGGLQRLVRLSLARPDAAAIAPLVAELSRRGAAPGWRAVADDLAATGHAGQALRLVESAPTGEAAGLWRTRFELTRRVKGDAAAAALAASAMDAGAAPARDLVAAAYAVDRPELVLRGVERGVLPRPDAATTLDLARRFAADDGLVARLDRVAGTGWRRADPWLAYRIAERGGDRAAMLRAAAALPAADAETAREAVLTRTGDRAGLRALLHERAARRPELRATIAERLLAEGDRAGAIAMLTDAATAKPADDPLVRRLLYLWGPRPSRAALDWLLARAARGAEGERADWLLRYADRDRPARALATLAESPLADRADILIRRLELAAATRDRAATDSALARLLDGRGLSAAQVAAIGGQAGQASAPLRLQLAERRVAHGGAMAGDRLAIARGALGRGQVARARTLIAAQLAERPAEVDALALMAEIETRGGERRALPWLKRALAASRGDSRERAAMLARLGDGDSAMAMLARLRAAAPDADGIAADQARLLIAAGQPGAARAMLAR